MDIDQMAKDATKRVNALIDRRAKAAKKEMAEDFADMWVALTAKQWEEDSVTTGIPVIHAWAFDLFADVDIVTRD